MGRKRETYEAPDIGAMIGRMLAALARRAAAGDLEAIEQLAELEETVDDQLAAGVAGAREFGYSWAAIGLSLGTSRQAAQQRFTL